MLTKEKIIKSFQEKFIKGVSAMSLPNGEVQEAEAWVEADIEELEEFIYSSLETLEEEVQRETLIKLKQSMGYVECMVDDDKGWYYHISKPDLLKLIPETTQGDERKE